MYLTSTDVADRCVVPFISAIKPLPTERLLPAVGL